ncbi:MAG: 1-acyl-sn-glycerol-3-phosphate acyltransferase [Ekhidna sp.]|nr:1-acyl-sn-glycerol-3-phosphate acyltransferase [Ekhidna sp.]MBC6408988.1 1-acyl-sn-glycerol-3-phosphate acyltransferase [Ekhidna sp.]
MSRKKVRYSEVIPNKNDWPIVQLSRDRKSFIDDIVNQVYEAMVADKQGSLREEIEMTVHLEKLRTKSNPWKVDPADDRDFWKELQQRLVEVNLKDKVAVKKQERDILKEIIDRYANEIAGSFKKSSYRFAQKFVTFGFARLLNAARVKGLLALFSRQLDLDDKLHITGETEHLRKLAKMGTVVMVPTHFSNLDSILIGWVIQFLGLPPFIYGAGLNLFNIKILAYFMNSLGAYKVDRRKKNRIYLETLKTYSRVAIERGCHSLFFPGGTRSRSGEIESRLKLGLLQTTIQAQREIYQKAEANGEIKKVFIVPAVINYHFTLEAPALIRGFLKKTGRERYYVEADEFSTSYKISTFLFKFFSKGSDISVNIGRGMDILGNYVDDEGISNDKKGNIIDPRHYFMRGNEITFDKQRENEYVRVLGKRIIEEYHKYNRVFASHLTAFIAFKMLERKNPKLDLYDILRLPEDDLTLDYKEFKANFKKLRGKLEKLYKKGKVDMAAHMQQKAEQSIQVGLKNLGLYHDKQPLVRKGKKIIINDTNTLYYYHNRMNGYSLEKYI